MKKNYETYTAEEFAADEEFIQWILNPTPATEKLWRDWSKRFPSKQTEMETARSLVLSLSFKKIDTSGMAGKIWQKIDAATNDVPQQKPSRTISLRLWLSSAAAACILLLLVSRYFANTVVQMTPGSQQRHILPESSVVTINDGSKISYSKKGFEKNRTIHLNGEAFFEVEKGSPFTVKTSLGTVEVLGTSFNVFNHNNQLEVRCFTGRVRVQTAAAMVELIAGQEAVLREDKTLQINEYPAGETITWLSGLYRYENSPLPAVCQELERQFNIRIILSEDMSVLRYTGFFEDSNLEKALQSVFWPLKLKYKLEGNRLILEQEE